MPATHLTKKYCQPKTTPYDPLKGLILDRLTALCYTPDDMAKVMDCHPNTARKRKKEPIREWKLGEILDLCKAMGVPIEELRSALRYKQ